MLSPDAGAPAGSSSTATSVAFYNDFLMMQPPQGVIANALTNLASIAFSPGTSDWTFETSTAYQLYSGTSDRVFSVNRQSYADFKATVNAQAIAVNQGNIANNFALINSNYLAISNNVANISVLQTGLTTANSNIATANTNIATLQNGLTSSNNNAATLSATVTSLQLSLANATSRIAVLETKNTASDTTTKAVAIAAIVIGCVGVLLTFLLGIYLSCLRPRNMAEGNRQAVMMTSKAGRSGGAPEGAQQL